MNEPLGSRPVRLGCYPLGALDVNGMKGLLSALDVKTDRIYDAYPRRVSMLSNRWGKKVLASCSSGMSLS